MKDCLLQQLEGVISNPNLPILEEMQQYTLDVIDASENLEMTDAQKWALNHLFYTLGKFDESEDSVWNKIDMIGLPIIAGNKDKATLDYTSPSGSGFANRRPSYVTSDMYDFVEKGLALVGTSTRYIMQKNATKNINTNNISMFVGFSQKNNSNQISLGLYDGDTEKMKLSSNQYVSETEEQRFGLIIAGQASYYTYSQGLSTEIRNFNVASWDGETTDGISSFDVQNDVVTERNIVISASNYQAISFNTKRIILSIGTPAKNAPIQFAIIGEGLTAEQSANIMDALNSLRNEFFVNA